jgi:hypothetical protein
MVKKQQTGNTLFSRQFTQVTFQTLAKYLQKQHISNLHKAREKMKSGFVLILIKKLTLAFL